MSTVGHLQSSFKKNAKSYNHDFEADTIRCNRLLVNESIGGAGLNGFEIRDTDLDTIVTTEFGGVDSDIVGITIPGGVGTSHLAHSAVNSTIGVNVTVSAADTLPAAVVGTLGGDVTITGGGQTIAAGTGAAGHMHLDAGDVTGAAATAAGGDGRLSGGDALAGLGGYIRVFSGASTTGTAGDVLISGAAGFGAAGDGEVSINVGAQAAVPNTANEVVRFTNQPLGVVNQALFDAGTVLLPSISLRADPNTGMFQTAADNISLGTGGVLRINSSVAGTQIGAAAVAVDQLMLPDGTAAVPSLAFISDLNTGIFINAAGNLAISDESQEVADFNAIGTGVTIRLGTEAAVTDVALTMGGGAAADDISINMTSIDAGGSVHISTSQVNTPGIVGNAEATNPTIAGSDTAGLITYDKNAGGAAGTLAVTYGTPYVGTAPQVVVTAGGSEVPPTLVKVVPNATTGFTIDFLSSAGADAGNNSEFFYHVIQ